MMMAMRLILISFLAAKDIKILRRNLKRKPLRYKFKSHAAKK